MLTAATHHPSPGFDAICRGRARASHYPGRILLAEDDDEMRALLAEALRYDGYHVLEVADGGRLLEEVNGTDESEIDLIISDIHMPVCSGVAVLQSIRSAGWTMPVIIMTAFGDEATRISVDGLGAVLFDKPFSLDDLRTAVINILAP